MAQAVKLGTAAPAGSVTPDYPGQIYVDTTGDTAYVAYGVANTDWQEVGGGGGGGGAGAGSQTPVINTATGGTLTVNTAQPCVVISATVEGTYTIACPAPAEVGDYHRVVWIFDINATNSVAAGTGFPTKWRYGSGAPVNVEPAWVLIFEWFPAMEEWVGTELGYAAGA